MSPPLIYYATPIITLVTSLVVAGTIWGALKTTVGHLQREISKLADQTESQARTLAEFREHVLVQLAEQRAAVAPRRKRG